MASDDELSINITADAGEAIDALNVSQASMDKLSEAGLVAYSHRAALEPQAAPLPDVRA